MAGRFAGRSDWFVGDPLNGSLNQLSSVLQRQLLFDMSLVGLHRLHTNVKLLGDLAGSVAFTNQAKNLELAVRQACDG